MLTSKVGRVPGNEAAHDRDVHGVIVELLLQRELVRLLQGALPPTRCIIIIASREPTAPAPMHVGYP
eukprot:8801188-Pyramimonas_sp.AAC.1